MKKAFYHGQLITEVVRYDEDGWVLFRTDHTRLHYADMSKVLICEVEE